MAGGQGKYLFKGGLAAGVCLHEVFLGASGDEFKGQAGKLRENFVDEADFGGEAMTMDVES